MQRLLKLLEKAIVFVSTAILVSALFLMVVIGALQIILRNIFASGLIWGDSVFRVLVLWVGFPAGVIATSRGRHIKIDLVGAFGIKQGARFVGVILSLFASFISLVLGIFSTRFVLSSAESGDILAGNIPMWVAEVIIPISFYFTSCVFLIHAARGEDRGI